MKYSDGDVLFDSAALAAQRVIDKENSYNFNTAFDNCLKAGMRAIDQFYLGGEFFHSHHWDDEHIRYLSKKYGIGYSVFNYSYLHTDYYFEKFKEERKEATGKYHFYIDDNGSGDIIPDEQTVVEKHCKITVQGTYTRHGELTIAHWQEKPHKYSSQGIGCINTLNRYEEMYKKNKKIWAKGKLIHPRFLFTMMVLFFAAAVGLSFPGLFIEDNLIGTIFGLASLGTSLISFFFIVRLIRKQVTSGHPLEYVTGILQSVLSLIVAAESLGALLNNTLPPTFGEIYILVIRIIIRCIPLFFFVIMVWGNIEAPREFSEEQQKVFKDNILECYPYFLEHYKEIVTTAGKVYGHSELQLLQGISGEGKLDNKKEEKQPKPKKEEEKCFIRQLPSDKNQQNQILSMIMRKLNINTRKAFKIMKGKTPIDLELALEIKKQVPAAKIIKKKTK